MRYLLITLLLVGCQARSTIKHGDASVTTDRTKENASLATSESHTTVDLPTGSVYFTKLSPEYFKDNQDWYAGWLLSQGASISHTTKTFDSSTGTLNTVVEQKKVDAAERRPLLYGAMLGVISAIFFVWMKYPTGVALSGIGSGILFACWKLDDLPDWVWILAIVMFGLSAGIYFGYERKDKEQSKGE